MQLHDKTMFRGTRRLRAFTVVELLVVIAITALLISLFLPGAAAARERAVSLVCASRLRQQYVGIRNYSNDFKSGVPTNNYLYNFTTGAVDNDSNGDNSWQVLAAPYLGYENRSQLTASWYGANRPIKLMPVFQCPSTFSRSARAWDPPYSSFSAGSGTSTDWVSYGMNGYVAMIDFFGPNLSTNPGYYGVTYVGATRWGQGNKLPLNKYEDDARIGGNLDSFHLISDFKSGLAGDGVNYGGAFNTTFRDILPFNIHEKKVNFLWGNGSVTPHARSENKLVLMGYTIDAAKKPLGLEWRVFN